MSCSSSILIAVAKERAALSRVCLSAGLKVFDYTWDGDTLEARYDVIDHLPERVGVESICEAKIPEISENMKKATKIFSDAFCEFPSCIATAYAGPQNAGPSTLFYEKPTGYLATMTCFAYDTLERWRSKYPKMFFKNSLKR